MASRTTRTRPRTHEPTSGLSPVADLFVEFNSKLAHAIWYLRAGMSCCRELKRFSAELFPIPVPFPWFQDKLSCRSRRRHQRWKVRRALEVLVNLQVAALNFAFGSQALGDMVCR